MASSDVSFIDGIVDSDLHPWLGEISLVFPYLSEGWRRRLEPRGHLTFWNGNPGRSPHFGKSILKPEMTPPGGGVPGSDPVFLAEDHLDRHGIAAGVLLMIEGGFLESWTDPDEAAAVAGGLNELVAETWLSVDERYHMAMAVSPHDPLLAAAEIRRFGPTERVCAVWLPLTDKPLGNRYFFPIFEAAEELGLPILAHPTGIEGDYMGGAGYAGGIPPLKAERMTLLGEIAMTNVVSLTFQGVFERFPGLKVIFSEYGFSWSAPLLWRMEAAWRAARHSMPWVLKSPTEYFREHIRFTTEPILEIPDAYMDQLLEAMQAERTLIYSSDYPHWDGEEDPGSILPTVGDDLKLRIFRENAIDTFGSNLVLPGVHA